MAWPESLTAHAGESGPETVVRVEHASRRLRLATPRSRGVMFAMSTALPFGLNSLV